MASAWDISGAVTAAFVLLGTGAYVARSKEGEPGRASATLQFLAALPWFVFCVARLCGAHA